MENLRRIVEVVYASSDRCEWETDVTDSLQAAAVAHDPQHDRSCFDDAFHKSLRRYLRARGDAFYLSTSSQFFADRLMPQDFGRWRPSEEERVMRIVVRIRHLADVRFFHVQLLFKPK
jgi:hypothetical protein